jgi:hypothetical protein
MSPFRRYGNGGAGMLSFILLCLVLMVILMWLLIKATTLVATTLVEHGKEVKSLRVLALIALLTCGITGVVIAYYTSHPSTDPYLLNVLVGITAGLLGLLVFWCKVISVRFSGLFRMPVNRQVAVHEVLQKAWWKQ